MTLNEAALIISTTVLTVVVYYGFIRSESKRKEDELWKMRNFIQKAACPEIFSVSGQGVFYVAYTDDFNRQCIDYFKSSKKQLYQAQCAKENGWKNITKGIYHLSDWEKWHVDKGSR